MTKSKGLFAVFVLMAAIRSAALSTDLILKLPTENQRLQPFWIGLHDRDEEGVFYWLDETQPAKYLSWGPGQPNNFMREDSVGQDCVQINYWSNGSRNWGDQDCGEQVRYICEKYIMSSPLGKKKQSLVVT
ncbi:versican core protein [Elysia marginata]|uniref:Versican core protein n=1 Tax=Elysia marginata TaxID=1093978 RepID=A0AAV4ERI6_9GAST|nr:versican core protein [Elysia marginata]